MQAPQQPQILLLSISNATRICKLSGTKGPIPTHPDPSLPLPFNPQDIRISLPLADAHGSSCCAVRCMRVCIECLVSEVELEAWSVVAAALYVGKEGVQRRM